MHLHVVVAIVITQYHMLSVEGESNVPLYICGHVFMPQLHRCIVDSIILCTCQVLKGESEMVIL